MANFDSGEPVLDDWLRQRIARRRHRLSTTRLGRSIRPAGARLIIVHAISHPAKARVSSATDSPAETITGPS